MVGGTQPQFRTGIRLVRRHKGWQGASVSKMRFRHRESYCLAEASEGAEARGGADTMDCGRAPL